MKLRSRRVADFNEPSVPHEGDQAEEILGAPRFGHVVFSDEGIEHGPQGSMLLDEMPDPGSDGIQGEVDTAPEVEQHHVLAEVPEEGLVTDPHVRRETDVGFHGSAIMCQDKQASRP